MSADEQALRNSRLTLSRREVARPLALLAGMLGAYLATMAAILAAPTALSIALAPICTIFLGAMFIIAHDACHQSFTSSPILNHAIGRIAFLPALTSFSLWDAEHNRRHHRWNNIRHLDIDFAPMSAEEFAAASPARRRWYAFSRSAVGVPFCYVYENWLSRLIFPRSRMLEKIGIAHWLDTALLCAFLPAYAMLLAAVGAWFGKGVLASVIPAFVLPFLFFNLAISVAIFVHHTHFRVPWYDSIEQWKDNRGAIFGTVHVKLSAMARKLTLNIMVHNAHHYAPGVPLYRLPKMQGGLNTPELVTWKWSLRDYREICARCKLFDFGASRWTDFAGVPTSGQLITTDRPVELAAS
jgi:acyl-lipid omega-6 desaturase (Delta-12 desaturase)